MPPSSGQNTINFTIPLVVGVVPYGEDEPSGMTSSILKMAALTVYSLIHTLKPIFYKSVVLLIEKKMVSKREILSRVQTYFSFSRREIYALVIAVFLTGFIFSFRDWGGDEFNLLAGLKNLLFAFLAAALVFFFRFSCQKVYGLAEGYKISFQPWWTGYIIALVLAFITQGYVPLVLIGSSSAAFISKHRMGEYRYGFSYWNQGIIGMWALYSFIILATLFSLAGYFFPQNYFFHKVVIISLISGFCTLLPIPQNEAFAIYYAVPWLYFLAILMMLAVSILLLTQTFIGIMAVVVVGGIIAVIYNLIGSEV